MQAIVFPVLIFIASAIVLFKSSKYVVEHALLLSKAFGISTLAIGFIVLSVSTSLPELMVAIFSALGNAPALAFGNIFGANFAALAFVLPICLIFGGAIYLKRHEVDSLIELLLIATVISLFIFSSGSVNFFYGIIFIALFAFLILRLHKSGKVPTAFSNTVSPDKKKLVAIFIASVLLLLLSSKFLVDSAIQITSILLIPQTIFGAIALAMGTTLPELSVELRAIKKKEYGLAMGDLFGSAVTNITLVLGVLAILSPSAINTLPLLVPVLLTFVAAIFIWWTLRKKGILPKKSAFFLIVLYAIFLILEFELLIPKIV